MHVCPTNPLETHSLRKIPVMCIESLDLDRPATACWGGSAGGVGGRWSSRARLEKERRGAADAIRGRNNIYKELRRR